MKFHNRPDISLYLCIFSLVILPCEKNIYPQYFGRIVVFFFLQSILIASTILKHWCNGTQGLFDSLIVPVNFISSKEPTQTKTGYTFVHSFPAKVAKKFKQGPAEYIMETKVFQYFYLSFTLQSTVLWMRKLCVFLLAIIDSLLKSCHNVKCSKELGSIESIERIYKRIWC